MSGEDPGKSDVTRRNSLPTVIQMGSCCVHLCACAGPSSQEVVTFVGSDCLRDSSQTEPRDQRRSSVRPTCSHRYQRREQALMSQLSDSGFEDDLGSSLISRRDETPPPAGQPSTWYLQYGDIGYQIQREKEAQYHRCRSLARQPQLTAEARCTLVSWLIPVHRYFHLSFECCCLAVNIVDRFLASTPVAADCFQLLGVTALFLASKQVEVCSPRISHLLSFCCDAFTKDQLCNLECLILLRLNFRLAAPTLAFFLDYYTNCIQATRLVSQNAGDHMSERTTPDTETHGQCSSLARKVCELSLADYAFNKYPPSLTAGCALWVARDLLKTEQGLAGRATVASKEDLWCDFVDELCIRPAYAQPPERHEQPVGAPSALKGRLQSLSEGRVNHSLAQECKENLKLLASLNLETLISM